ncbi:MAG: hypothetical protein V4710_07585 [Verrucomicrobiota bacterium]
MSPVKTRAFIVSLLTTLLSACAAFSPTPQLLYGLSDDELNLLGQRLGYRVDALGMSVYSFTRSSHVFHVAAHIKIPVTRRVQADEMVVVSYDPPGHKPPVESRLSVERGVTFTIVESHFRRFLHEMQLPATTPTNP